MGKHPAEMFIRYLHLKEPSFTNDAIDNKLKEWGCLTPDPDFYVLMRARLGPETRPEGFDPNNRLHRASMKYLRDNGVYDLFYPGPEMEQAWEILANPEKRLAVEQVILSRLDPHIACSKLNAKKPTWFLSAGGIKAYQHAFWNRDLLTFDEWGRFLYSRTSMYERHMALLQATPTLALHHLHLEQVIESKVMIQRAQMIAYMALEEVNLKPGTGADKVKAISVLTKAVTDCHVALSTSDMALKDVLKQFERFRMEDPMKQLPSIQELAPQGNFTGSGIEEKEKVH